MPNTNPLPDDGDVIEFEKVPSGSLIPQPIVTPEGSKPLPKRRYRVEHKPLDREYLLVDTVSGHASRVPAHEFKRAKWDVVVPEGPAAIADEQLSEAAKETPSTAQPLSSETTGDIPAPPGSTP